MASPHTLVSVAAALAVAGLLLTGCASAGGTQSTAQACKILETDLTSASSDLSTAFSTLQSDPSGAEKGLVTFENALKKSTAKVTNTKVRAKADATVTSITAMDDDLKVYIADTTKTAGLEKSATKVQSTFTALGKSCTA